MQQGSNQWVAAAATAATWCTVVLVVPVLLLGSIISAVLGQDLWQVPTLACWVPLAMLQGTLLVASLSGTTSRQELLYLFSQYGELREVRPVAAQAALTVNAGMPAVVCNSSTAAHLHCIQWQPAQCVVVHCTCSSSLHMLESTPCRCGTTLRAQAASCSSSTILGMQVRCRCWHMARLASCVARQHMLNVSLCAFCLALQFEGSPPCPVALSCSRCAAGHRAAA